MIPSRLDPRFWPGRTMKLWLLVLYSVVLYLALRFGQSEMGPTELSPGIG